MAPAPGGGDALFDDAYDPRAGSQGMGPGHLDGARRPVRRPLDDPLPLPAVPGGSIDASLDERRAGDVLVWKSDGQDQIWSQQLGADDASLVGTPNLLVAPSAPFDGRGLRGPALVRIGGPLTLWFSAGRWSGAGDGIGMAVGRSALGPCAHGSGVPELTDAAGPVGPAGPSFFSDDARLTMAFAGWVDGRRQLYLARVSTR